MKNFINKNKKIIIIELILSIIIILLSNPFYFISLLNKTEPIIYNQQNITNENNTYYIENIKKEINIIEINFQKIPEEITINYTDNNFKNYTHLNASYKNNEISRNKKYILVSTNSVINNLQFELTNGEIENIIINPKVNLNISFLPLFITLITLIYYAINYKNKLDFNNIIHKIIIIGIILNIIIIIFIFYQKYIQNSYFFGDMYEYHYVNAIKKGNLNLDYHVNKALIDAENPYDTSNRFYTFLWDASYYNEKYYCYFGILPIIILFLPYNIITNNYLTTPTGCLIYSILAIIGTYLLFKKIVQKYFNTITFEQFIVSFLFIILGTKIFWCMNRPSFYELVSLAAYTHITFGLYLILFKNNKITDFLGYLLLASSVLCRPTALFASILIIPKLINKIKTKNFKLPDILILIIPYITIGIITMYLNYIRFNNIFEFGISYQLTTNNLYNNNYSIINGIYGTLKYLFGGIKIDLVNLSIKDTPNIIPYITDFNYENIGGGIFTTSILGIIILFIPKIFKFIKEKELKVHIILALILAFFTMLFSSSIGAIVGRYMLDFNYIFYFITVILCLYTINKYNKNKYINKIYLSLAIISILINFFISNGLLKS